MKGEEDAIATGKALAPRRTKERVIVVMVGSLGGPGAREGAVEEAVVDGVTSPSPRP